MKTLLLVSFCTSAVASATFAQGTVNWSGPSAAFYTTETNSTQFSSLLGGGGATGFGSVGPTSTVSGSYFFELLYQAYTGNGSLAPQPGSLTQLETWNDTGLGGHNGTVAGRDAVSVPNFAQILPWGNGTTDSVMLVEWSSALGTTWSAALSSLQTGTWFGDAYIGFSQTGFINPSTSTTLGATLFSNAPQGAAGDPINSLNTQLYLLPLPGVIPEPSTMALAAFGGLSLLALRRKK